MSSEDIDIDLSRSVHPAENDAGRELLDHLSMDPNLEMKKRMLTTRFSNESLIFAFQKLQETQPTEITGENVNLRIEKESDKRCLKVLFKELRKLIAENARKDTLIVKMMTGMVKLIRLLWEG